MAQAFVITLREGLEAFLIVAISLAYLRKTGRAQLTAAVHWGIGVAIAISAAAGYLLFNAANQEFLRGIAPWGVRDERGDHEREADDCDWHEKQQHRGEGKQRERQ